MKIDLRLRIMREVRVAKLDRELMTLRQARSERTNVLRCVVLLMICLSIPATACGEIVIGYEAADVDNLPASTSASGVTANDVTRGSGVEKAGGSSDSSYNTNSWDDGGSDTNDLAEATSQNEYLEWGFTSTQSWNLTSVGIANRRTSSGPSDMALFANVNGAGFNLSNPPIDDIDISGNTNSSSSNPGATNTISLSFTDVTSIVFRLYAYGATGSTGSLRLVDRSDNSNLAIQVSGNLAAVPEPSGSALLAGCFAVGLVVRHWRRRPAA
ncbi:MAG: hypothetical protein ACE361_21255 [Aureliella sp.]